MNSRDGYMFLRNVGSSERLPCGHCAKVASDSSNNHFYGNTSMDSFGIHGRYSETSTCSHALPSLSVYQLYLSRHTGQESKMLHKGTQ